MTRTPPFHVESGQLVFYDVIDTHITSRSSVLSCILEAGGDATLPEAIRLLEFKIWITAAQTDRYGRQSMKFESICTALKVRRSSDQPLVIVDCVRASAEAGMNRIDKFLVNRKFLTGGRCSA